MADAPKDPPIEPQSFLAGTKVVDIGEIRVARGFTRRAFSGCGHRKLFYDARERRVWCGDCESNIENFDAFELLVSKFDRANKDLERRQQALDEAETHQLRSLAAREIDKAWRKRTMIPACPSCGAGLWPDDFKNGVASMVGREYDAARRAKAKP